MRIFQVLSASSNASVSSNQTWYRNLYEPLVELGHDVILLPADLGSRAMRANDRRLRGEFSQNLLDSFHQKHKESPFDLFFSYLMDGMVDVGVIDEIRKTGVPTCNFSCNNAHQFYLVDELSPHFDYNLHSERDVRDKFLDIGANPLWWPMASNPRYFRPVDIPQTIDVSFVGANYALRARYIGQLLRHGIDVHAFGPGWAGGARSPWRSKAKRFYLLWKSITSPRIEKQARYSGLLAEHDFNRQLYRNFSVNLHGPVSDEKLIELYSSSRLSLGFLEVYDRHDPSQAVTRHLHLREFEAPMSGALYCTGYMEELEEFFEPDKEIIVYRNQYELVDKVKYYRKHEKLADQIRWAGYKRATTEHTYQHRFRSLFGQLGLD